MLATHEISHNLLEQIIDPTRFSSWNKLLLTLATVFNLVFWIKKQRTKDQLYITEDVILARNWLIKMSQQNFFFSTIQALKHGSRVDSKCKIRSLNPMLDNNGILRSCERLQFAPDNLDVEKFPIILHAKDMIARLYIEHAHNICVHQGTEPVKSFVQQRYPIIGLRKTILSIKYRCFLCRRFAVQNFQHAMAPLPNCRFPTDSNQYPFANSGVDFFGPFYIEDAKGQIEKHYGLIFTCLVTRCVHLEACLDLNIDTFLNAYRRFVSRRCPPTTMLSDIFLVHLRN